MKDQGRMTRAATEEEQHDGTQPLGPGQHPVCLVLQRYPVLLPMPHALCQAPRTDQTDADTVLPKLKMQKEINNYKISDEKKLVWSQRLAVNHTGAPQAAPHQESSG